MVNTLYEKHSCIEGVCSSSWGLLQFLHTVFNTVNKSNFSNLWSCRQDEIYIWNILKEKKALLTSLDEENNFQTWNCWGNFLRTWYFYSSYVSVNSKEEYLSSDLQTYNSKHRKPSEEVEQTSSTISPI